MHHFFVSKSNIDGERVELSRAQAHQVCHVLRLRAGQTIVVLDDTGAEYDVTLTTVTGREVTGQIASKRSARGEPTVQITLVQSLLAREKFEWVLQKGTEVGVYRFAPVATQRTLVRAKQIDARKMTRWRRILTEAAEQSHRGRVPQLDLPVGLNEAAATLRDFDCALIAVLGEDSPSLKETLADRGSPAASVAILIGPEGGFSPDEISQASENGATRISLGPRILRTETAAIVASAMILYELGQM
jgi:16S rRNA (uracil1498-N3)-methyltransferase